MGNLGKKLLVDGYQARNHNFIYSKPAFDGIAYSDGIEVENALLETLKGISDLSVLSAELMLECKDWVSTYHFSHNRANLLRPFKDSITGTVLELGAGCGAITRYLGETSQEVVAVEGSFLRCEINAERVRDLENVNIVCSELSDFETALKFDAVVVVGVLEYAALFGTSTDPHRNFLKKARSFLKPEGVLLLAIENKLGLKYFAGVPEDHIGIPMFGIEGRYSSDGVRTFSAPELRALAGDAGFNDVSIHSPLPDYKIVRGLVTEQGLVDPRFDSGELASQLVYKDPQVSVDQTFNLRRTWLEVGKAHLDKELSNSFLVEARVSGKNLGSGNPQLAFWYGGDRPPNLLVEKTFYRDIKSNLIYVSEAKLGLDLTQDRNQQRFQRQTIPLQKYIEGTTFAREFDDILDKENWTLDELVSKTEEFLSLVGNWAKNLSTTWPENPKPSSVIESNYLDLVPHNVKRLEDQSVAPFDLEWSIAGNLTLGHLIFRSILNVLGNRPIFFAFSGATTEISMLNTLNLVCERLGLSAEDLNRSIRLEWELQNTVRVSKLSLETYISRLDQPLLAQTQMAMLAQQIIALSNERDSLAHERDSLAHERDSLAHERDSALGDINQIKSSNSWIITKPLRFLSSLARKLKKSVLKNRQ